METKGKISDCLETEEEGWVRQIEGIPKKHEEIGEGEDMLNI
jgi:hypothetical protein